MFNDFRTGAIDPVRLVTQLGKSHPIGDAGASKSRFKHAQGAPRRGRVSSDSKPDAIRGSKVRAVAEPDRACIP